MQWFNKLFRSESNSVSELDGLIKQLKRDSSQHERVGSRASDKQISLFEKSTGFILPPSYRSFVKRFGDGAYWLYGSQPVDSINNPIWLRDLRPRVPDFIKIDGGGEADKNTLLCLMTEDSNGGSWCWLTAERDTEGESSLAYFSQDRLYYKQLSFVNWLNILVSTKTEVIRELDYDKADKLGLG